MAYYENQPQKRSGCFSARVVLALLFAVIGLSTYYFNQQVNPVTGEKQRIALSVEQEVALGAQAAPQMGAQMGGIVSPSDPQAQRVARVGEKVVANSAARKSPYPFRFHLVNDSRTINAFALPGGQIFITRALLDKMTNEDQLAAVLGHEIGHVIHRHSAEHMAKGQLGQILATAFGIGASDDPRSSQGAAAAAQMANQMVQLRFSRSDELESDDTGIDYMVEAGYNPRGMLELMQILAEASKGDRPPEMLSTHPMPEDRIRRIEEKIRTPRTAERP